MSETGHFTRAQLIAGFWTLFGLWNVGTGVTQFLDGGLDLGSGGSLALGVAGLALAALYARNPERVANGTERVDRRVEAFVVFLLVFVAVVAAYSLLA